MIFFVGCLSTIFLRAYSDFRRRQRRARRCSEFVCNSAKSITGLEGAKVDPDNVDELCSICFDPFADLDVATGLCGHTFHCTCIQAWLAKDIALSCPLCRCSFVRDCEQMVDSPV